MRLAPVFVLSALMLGACDKASPPGTLPDEDACGASGMQSLVGQDEGALAAMTFPDTTRFIKPGMAVTMDYSPNRLNIEFDEGDRVARVFCG